MTEAGKSLRDVDKPFYRYWQALYKSFYSSALYVDIGKRWKGLGLGYLLLLMFILSIPFSFRIIDDSLKFFKEVLLQPIKNLPVLYVQNGQVSVNKPMPYYVKNKNNQIIAIVDTTGAVTTMDQNYPDLNILITKDKLLYHFPNPQFFFAPSEPQNTVKDVYVFPFGEKANFVFDGKEWVKSSAITHLKTFIAVLLYPTLALLAFGVFLVFIFAFALMGQFIAKLFFKLSIRYSQSCRLLIVSMTPFFVTFWVILALGYFTRGYGFFLPLLIIIYFCYAILSLKRQSNKMVFT